MDKPDVELTNGEFTLLKRQAWAEMVTHAYATQIDGVTGERLYNKIGLGFGADTRHADLLASMLNAHPILQREAQRRGFKNVAIAIHTRDMSPAAQKTLMH